MKICGFNKTTLLDYPGRVACTIFLGGCNFRCPFCQNGALVVEPDTQPEYSQEEILAFLKKSALDGMGNCLAQIHCSGSHVLFICSSLDN